jgi:hypothetical protein
MRTSIIVFTAMAVLLVPSGSKSDSVRDPGAGFIDQKRPKAGKNYYIVRKDNACAIKTGKFGDQPPGMIGDAPYASKVYAKAALKKIPECEGSEVEDETSGKKHKKEKD